MTSTASIYFFPTLTGVSARSRSYVVSFIWNPFWICRCPAICCIFPLLPPYVSVPMISRIWLSFLFMINLLFSLYNYLPIHMPEHHIYSWSPSRPEEGAASTRTRITESWWVTKWSRNWTRVLWKQSLDCWTISPVHKFPLIFLWEHNLPHYYFKLLSLDTVTSWCFGIITSNMCILGHVSTFL